MEKKDIITSLKKIKKTKRISKNYREAIERVSQMQICQ